MRDGAWLVVALLCGGGAFYGGMRVAERGETKCVSDVTTASARGQTEPQKSAHARAEPSTASTALPQGRLMIACAPSKNVSVLIDGHPKGDVCPIELDVAVGPHQIEVRAPHHRAARSTTTVEASKTTRVALELEDEAGLFYRAKIEFTELRAQAVDDLRDGKIAVINGEVRNHGERRIREVQLAVDFLDEQGGVIARRFLHPVLEQGGAFIAPRESRRFALKVPEIPLATWSRRIRWSVSLIGIAEIPATGNPSGVAPR